MFVLYEPIRIDGLKSNENSAQNAARVSEKEGETEVSTSRASTRPAMRGSWVAKMQKSNGMCLICRYYEIQCIQADVWEIGAGDLCEFGGNLFFSTDIFALVVLDFFSTVYRLFYSLNICTSLTHSHSNE